MAHFLRADAPAWAAAVAVRCAPLAALAPPVAAESPRASQQAPWHVLQAAALPDDALDDVLAAMPHTVDELLTAAPPSMHAALRRAAATRAGSLSLPADRFGRGALDRLPAGLQRLQVQPAAGAESPRMLGITVALHLAHLPNLRALSLAGSRLGGGTIAAVAGQLHKLPALTELDLSGVACHSERSELGAVRLTAAALAPALPHLPALHCLDLSDNGLCYGALAAVLQPLAGHTALRALRVARNVLDPPAAGKKAVAAPLALPAGLSSLDLSGTLALPETWAAVRRPGLVQAVLAELAAATALQQLSFAENALEAQLMRTLAQLTALRALDVGGCYGGGRRGSDGAAVVPALPALTSLRAAPQCIDHAARFPALRELRLTADKDSKPLPTMYPFVASLGPQLRRLQLDGVTLVPPFSRAEGPAMLAAALSVLTRLTELDASSCWLPPRLVYAAGKWGPVYAGAESSPLPAALARLTGLQVRSTKRTLP